MDLFEAMSTLRSIRRVKPDPIPEADLRRIVEAALWAPSGGNRQPWRFVVVRDPARRRRLGDCYRESAHNLYGAGYFEPPPDATPAMLERLAKRRAIAERFAAHFHEAPVIVVACTTPADYVEPPFTLAGSTFPAIQNLMLAARALGVGSVVTTAHLQTHERQVAELLKLPDGVVPVALIPMGYPQGRFGPLQRRPLEEVCFAEEYGAALDLPNDQ